MDTHLPEEEVAQTLDAARADEDVERGAAHGGGHETGIDVFFRDLAVGQGP